MKAKKLMVDVKQLCHVDDFEDDQRAYGDVPSPKRPKQAASFTDEATAGSGRRGQPGSRRHTDDAEDLNLEDYVPDYCIDSHEKRDSCSLAITMTHTARSVDITELSGDIVKLVFKGKKAFVRYVDPETAAANLKIIEKAVGKGKVLRVEKCTTRKQNTIGNMLDLFRLPANCTVARLKQQFPGSRVHVLKHGFARLGFASTEDLKRALQPVGCHIIDGHDIRLSLVKKLQKEDDSHYYGGGRQSRDSRGDSDSSSRGGRNWKRNSWPLGERAYWRGGGRGCGRGAGYSRMGNRSFDWDGRGDWSEVDDWDSRAWSGGSRFFWNSEGGGRRGRRGGRRGSWSRP
ncbi:hypothetical protein HPB49_023013 [Dermacentor silvarum]|uniref:Uncharacterized protein n=1 Tax=Dermacentor silvarum TaxID=543639 RepID=A0ACB8E3Y1_DERSI|nr:hypothetical protein HPB49_023013 [Dermacentor silvarum]